MSSVDLVKIEPLLPMSPDAARQAMVKYQELTAAMLTAEDWQSIPSGKFVKRSGFQKIASGYGVSTEIVSEEIERGQDGKPVRAHAIVRATHPNGRHADGSGRCSVDESRFRQSSGRAKAEHDIAATAATRATNRAISNLVGFGQVSAEEIDGAGGGTPAGLPYGPEGDADTDAKAIEAIEALYPIQGETFVRFVCDQFGTRHLPAASARMLGAIQWALGNERMRRAPAEPPPEAEPVEQENSEGVYAP